MAVLTITDLTPVLPPAINLWGLLTVGSLSTSAEYLGPKCSIIVECVTPQAAERVFSESGILQADTSVETTNPAEVPDRAFSLGSEIARRGVRPCVQEFIKRVIVPILVQRYIAQRNCDTLPARSKESV